LIIKKRYVDGNPFVKITLESEEDYEWYNNRRCI
jgi:hypothetical protein